MFGTLFNDIHITRTDTSGNMTNYIKVPITYAPKDKMLARIEQDPNIDRPTAVVTLPMMSFEMAGFHYDGSRKLATVGKSAYRYNDNPDQLRYQYNPVPYDIDFKLYIYVKNAEDGTKIVEQILPYFTPDFTTTLKLIPDMNINMDIPTVLKTVEQTDTYEGSFQKRRAIIWTLTFTMKGYVFGPVKKSAIIKYSNTAFYTPLVADLQDGVGNSTPVGYVQVQPGLTANGQPTSNSSLSIPVDEILVTDDFGYVVNIEETNI